MIAYPTRTGGVIAAAGSPEACPPSVIRGAELHDAPRTPETGETKTQIPHLRRGVSIGIDWLRMTGRQSLLGMLRFWAGDRWGRGESIGGRMFYASGERYGPGVVVLWDHSTADSCCVEISGSVLADMTADERIELARELHAMGLEATRVDIAADFIEQGLSIVENAIASCKGRELTGARTFDPREPESCGKLIGRTCYIGARGKNGSGRLTRPYDKGLETKTAPPGVWERYEAEFTGEKAGVVLAELVLADDWKHEAAAHLFADVDFREAIQEGQNRSLERRPRLAWWQKVLDCFHDQAKRVRIPRRLPDLQRFSRWWQRAVLPSVQAMAQATGRTIDELSNLLVGEDVPASRNSEVLIAQLRSFMRDPCALAIGPPAT